MQILSFGMCAISSHKYRGLISHSHVYVIVIYRNRFNISPTVAKNVKEVINFLYFFFLAPWSSFDDRVVKRSTWAVMYWQIDNVAPEKDTLKHPTFLQTQYIQDIARVFITVGRPPLSSASHHASNRSH